MIFKANHLVEKDGTGIAAREAVGNPSTICGIRANITQDV